MTSNTMFGDGMFGDGVKCWSLWEAALDEAEKDRWYRSEEAGCDQGEHAMREWVSLHWRGFLRARWVEHMQGYRFWLELPREEFGLLHRRDLVNARHLLDEIMEHIRCGAENLDIVRWARRTKPPAEQVTILELLILININAHRLRCSFCDD